MLFSHRIFIFNHRINLSLQDLTTKEYNKPLLLFVCNYSKNNFFLATLESNSRNSNASPSISQFSRESTGVQAVQTNKELRSSNCAKIIFGKSQEVWFSRNAAEFSWRADCVNSTSLEWQGNGRRFCLICVSVLWKSQRMTALLLNL